MVQVTSATKLCKTSTVVCRCKWDVPWFYLYARQDDVVIVQVTSLTPYRHGVRHRPTCWFDGPAYITQCPIRTERSFTYKFTVLKSQPNLMFTPLINAALNM